MLKLIIDGDVLIYKSAAAVEHPVNWGNDLWTLHSSLDEAKQAFSETLYEIIHTCSDRFDDTIKTVFALSDRKDNFRKHLWPQYKANRANKRSPLCRGPLYDWMRDYHNVRIMESLEADDVIGILMTFPGKDLVQRCIVSVDKDFKTIPGKHYDLASGEFYESDANTADYWFMVQTLTGDVADGYPGCPGYGPKTAEKVLGTPEDHPPLAEMWSRVLECYRKKNLGADYALTMARMARILRAEDYDPMKGAIPWSM